MTMPNTTSSALPRGNGACFGLLAALAALASGCTQTPQCSELAECGGPPPVGVWELVPGTSESCQEDLYNPTVDTRLKDSEVPAARIRALEPALFDWCNLLIARGGDDILANSPQFYYESGRIGQATVTYNADGTFSAGLTRTGTFVLDFPPVCMRSFSAVDGKSINPDDPAAPIGNVCKQLEGPLALSGAGEGSYRNTTCEPNPVEPEGCLCGFDVTETGGPGGTYRMLAGNKIEHFSNTNFPAKVSYCNGGNTLELTGADGAYLFNYIGLRTLRLALVGAGG